FSLSTGTGTQVFSLPLNQCRLKTCVPFIQEFDPVDNEKLPMPPLSIENLRPLLKPSLQKGRRLSEGELKKFLLQIILLNIKAVVKHPSRYVILLGSIS
ncbi:MAG: hypothetical protein PSN04_06550, partial [Methyloprofundus sp.]|nr:hypothetical protein [Methyloprofundus sp.]